MTTPSSPRTPPMQMADKGEKLSDELLAEIAKGCEGVTPGPWHVQSGADKYTHIVRDEHNGFLFSAPQGSNGQQATDVAHIARLAPQTVLALVTELQAYRSSPSTSTGESDWVLVPREPAVNMRHVGGEVVEERQGHSTPRDLAAAVYREMVMAASLHTPRAMLASAPAPDPFVDDEPISPGMQAVIDGTKAKIREAFAPAPDTKQERPAIYIGVNDVTALVPDDMADVVRAAFAALPKPEFGEPILPLYLHPSPVTQKVSEAWQPIETAPKDGTRILATCASAQAPRASVTWWEGKWLIQIVPDQFVSGDPRQWFPTHWQPLPAPPLQAQEKSE